MARASRNKIILLKVRRINPLMAFKEQHVEPSILLERAGAGIFEGKKGRYLWRPIY